MNRAEFCQLMLDAKAKSGVGSSQLSFDLRVLPGSLRRLERGLHNFSMEKAVEYLNVIGYVISLNGKYDIKLKSYDMFPLWLPIAREKISQRKLAEKLDIRYATIANIETNKNYITVDNFLKIADTLDYEIKIEKL
jgi:DNA-binding XRE family transcriptional regulator